MRGKDSGRSRRADGYDESSTPVKGAPHGVFPMGSRRDMPVLPQGGGRRGLKFTAGGAGGGYRWGDWAGFFGGGGGGGYVARCALMRWNPSKSTCGAGGVLGPPAPRGDLDPLLGWRVRGEELLQGAGILPAAGQERVEERDEAPGIETQPHHRRKAQVVRLVFLLPTELQERAGGQEVDAHLMARS